MVIVGDSVSLNVVVVADVVGVVVVEPEESEETPPELPLEPEPEESPPPPGEETPPVPPACGEPVEPPAPAMSASSSARVTHVSPFSSEMQSFLVVIRSVYAFSATNSFVSNLSKTPTVAYTASCITCTIIVPIALMAVIRVDEDEAYDPAHGVVVAALERAVTSSSAEVVAESGTSVGQLVRQSPARHNWGVMTDEVAMNEGATTL